MGQKFCTGCGAKLPEGIKFCESCGTPVEPAPVPPETPQTSRPEQPGYASPPSPGSKKFPAMVIAGIVILLIIAVVAVVVVLPKLQDGSLSSLTGQPTTVPTTIATPTPLPTVEVTTTIPTLPPDPFPDAYHIKEIFTFNNDSKYKSRATVYRYWMNETYRWHNDMDNKYWVQKPKAGNKYLFVFVNIENIGSDGYPYPKSNMIVVHNGGNLYRVDTSHYLPNKAGDADATPIEVEEIYQQSDYFNQELVEDYGYSHGTTQDFVYPGQGNAIDGYLIYEVPASLRPEESWVEIVFDGQDKAVWKLVYPSK